MNNSFRKLIKKEQWEHVKNTLVGTTQQEVWSYVVTTSKYNGFVETKLKPGQIVLCNGHIISLGYEDKSGCWHNYPFSNLKRLSLETAKFYLETVLRMEDAI